MNKALSFLLSLLCACSTALSGGKPQVAVRFKIEASAYRNHFGAGVANVENHAAEVAMQALKQNIQFADFAAPNAGSSPYTLTVFLAVSDPQTDVAAQAVWLMASLTGPDGTSPKATWRKFREAAADCGGLSDRECTWPDEAEFLKELQALLTAPSLYPNLVSGVFQELSIANSGKFVIEPTNGWVLPFRQEEMCLGTDTKLRIVNDIPTEQTTLHGKFRADVEGPYGHPPDSIFTTLSEGEDGADNSKKALLQQSPEKVVVRGAYLVRYQHLDENCGGAIPPPTAPGTAGGDSTQLNSSPGATNGKRSIPRLRRTATNSSSPWSMTATMPQQKRQW